MFDLSRNNCLCLLYPPPKHYRRCSKFYNGKNVTRRFCVSQQNASMYLLLVSRTFHWQWIFKLPIPDRAKNGFVCCRYSGVTVFEDEALRLFNPVVVLYFFYSVNSPLDLSVDTFFIQVVYYEWTAQNHIHSSCKDNQMDSRCEV